MAKSIKINMEVMESMLYYWEATADKEKVGESYIMGIADREEMKAIYDDEFTSESVRRALSAISNREPFKQEYKKEGRFWNNNMWMLEDLDFMRMMLDPLKTMNLDHILEELEDGEYEVVILPMHLDVHYKKENTLYLNFFRVKADLYEENKITIEDMEPDKYILDALK